MILEESNSTLLKALTEKGKCCSLCSLVNSFIYVPPLWIGNSEKIKIAFIGEAPGEEEVKQMKPFIGRAGRKLQELLKKLDLVQDIFITNILKHRPPNNRKPTKVEADACGKEFLLEELLITKPQLIVCLGRTAAEFFIRNCTKLDMDITKKTLRGLRFSSEISIKENLTISTLCTWHPAYILRNGSKEQELIDDLTLAKNLVEGKT